MVVIIIEFPSSHTVDCRPFQTHVLVCCETSMMNFTLKKSSLLLFSQLVSVDLVRANRLMEEGFRRLICLATSFQAILLSKGRASLHLLFYGAVLDFCNGSRYVLLFWELHHGYTLRHRCSPTSGAVSETAISRA